jgi:hypothetical protein
MRVREKMEKLVKKMETDSLVTARVKKARRVVRELVILQVRAAKEKAPNLKAQESPHRSKAAKVIKQ